MEDLTFDIGYVGSANKKQIGYAALNTAPIPGPGPVNPRRLLPDFGELDWGSNMYNSNYNSLQTKIIKRFSKGLQLNVNYAWGRSMDDQSSLAESKTQDPINRRADYSRSSFDLRQVFQFSYVYELPFGKGKKFGGGWNRAADLALGGWSLVGLTRVQSNAPVNVVVGQDRANVGRSVQRPNVIRDPNTGPRTPDKWFDTGAFVLQPIYTFGNAGAFIVQSDKRHNWDISAQKDFRIREGQVLEFRAEFFNLSNSVQMNDPQNSFASSAFGQVTGATPARQIQFGLRYSF